ncbi:hypothetical protein JCM3775_003016 [Rhodotorula graminis]|uniref:Maltose/galactoside acetyltransferase domain-containing protein n=1 Tax=Rhodotorula graminis (strain WP1) TaxID=578459 RepID=A0A194S7T2_RHOGW|nr:uncharacterized protein RHOBADRAFT_66239 [Rhodotorula graminis WP1]KPV76619.1 hypothetical protein RHOBADRAFT_66239 [Rhodotorula graminis WP1]
MSAPTENAAFEAATPDELAVFQALSEREKMVQGLAYLALEDKGLTKDRLRARTLCQQYNTHPFTEWRDDLQLAEFYGPDSRLQNLADLFRLPLAEVGRIGIEPPLYVDYGYNIEFKGDFYANFGCVFLDCAKISFGKGVLLGPAVHIYCATHSILVDERVAGYERAYPVEIGDNTWIGGGVKIIGPAKIGANCTIAAGSVVKGDFPDNVVIGGMPARVLKYLDEPTGPIDPTNRRLVVPLPGAKSAAKNDKVGF